MIQFKNVVKKFRAITVLNQVDLTISAGERLALVGFNGAGKTTLIRCLLGEYSHQGEVWVNGQASRLHRQQILTQVGFVPQLPPPLKMPVGQLLQFAADLCHSPIERMRMIGDRLGLDFKSVWHRPFVKLSGGQKQKTLISIALGRNSRILIMDEPAASLDPPARRIFFQLLAEFPQNTVMLISSHRLDEVAALVNRVVEMDRGQIVLDDKVVDQITQAHLYCRLHLNRAEMAFANALQTWQFITDEQNLTWHGQVASADRLRFLGMLSRYASLLAHVELEEMP
jgi:ABC-2 type transport system ATP-binding protein